MKHDLFSELFDDVLLEESGRLDYTRRAYGMLPEFDNPKILDIGCGEGEPTIELAKLSNGLITGLDVDKKALDKLKIKIEEKDLSNRIKILNMSMLDIDFPDESFDIIWAEGSIFFVGFEEGLKNWRRFIKHKGFLVVHEMCWLRPNPPDELRVYWEKIYPGISTVKENLEKIPKCGYLVIGHFQLPEKAWWDLYYGPLQGRVFALMEKYLENPWAIAVLEKEQKEIDLYRKYSKWYGSAYYVMQKK